MHFAGVQVLGTLTIEPGATLRATRGVGLPNEEEVFPVLIVNGTVDSFVNINSGVIQGTGQINGPRSGVWVSGGPERAATWYRRAR